MSQDVHKCHRGHVKEPRSYGWYCVECERINRHARVDAAYKAQSAPAKPRGVRNVSKSTPTDLLCKRGHSRVVRPSGRLACPTCQNMFAAARRRLLMAKTCLHIDEPGFDGVMSKRGILVCLACLVEQAGAV